MSSHLLWSSNYDRQIKAFAFPLITLISDSGIVPSCPSVPHLTLISHIGDLDGSFATTHPPFFLSGLVDKTRMVYSIIFHGNPWPIRTILRVNKYKKFFPRKYPLNNWFIWMRVEYVRQKHHLLTVVFPQVGAAITVSYNLIVLSLKISMHINMNFSPENGVVVDLYEKIYILFWK